MQQNLLYDENILLCIIFGTMSLCYLFNSLSFAKEKLYVLVGECVLKEGKGNKSNISAYCCEKMYLY